MPCISIIGVHVCIYTWQFVFSACKSTRNTTLCKLCGQLVQTQSQRSSHANTTNLLNSEKYDAPNNLAIPNSCWSLQPTRANTETATHRIPTASPNQHAEAPHNTDTTRGIACYWIHLHVISSFFILPTWTHMFFLFPLTTLWIRIKTLTLEWY